MTGDAHIDGQLKWIMSRLNSEGATRVLLTGHVHSWAEATLANDRATPAMKETAATLKDICERDLNGELPNNVIIGGLIVELAGLYRDGQRHNASKSRESRTPKLKQAFNLILAINPRMNWKQIEREIAKGTILPTGEFVQIKRDAANRIIPIIDGKPCKPVSEKTFMQYRERTPEPANDGLFDG